MLPDSVVPAVVAAAELPIPYAALEAAAARLRPALAPPLLVRRALATCLAEPRWSYRLVPTARGQELVLQIRPSSATLRASRTPPKWYEVRAASCTCKGSFVHGCKHPTACVIVAEALEPTTSVLGMVPAALLGSLLGFAAATAAPSLALSADSGAGSLTLAYPAVATATVALDLRPECRALLRIGQQLARSDSARLCAALREHVAPSALIDVEVAAGSLTLCAWEADQICWYDGAVLADPPAPR